MGARRDYGTFIKAASRQLEPLIADLGYRKIVDGAFGRSKGKWMEGFFLSQSRLGSGDYSVILGIHIPRYDELWHFDPTLKQFTLVVSGGLRSTGFDPSSEDYHAANAAELNTSIQQIVRFLPAADSWFATFKSLDDVAAEYKRVNKLGAVGTHGIRDTLSLINYGLLLLVANRVSEARLWLEEARRNCQLSVARSQERLERRRPSKLDREEAALAVRRLEVVKGALEQLPSSAS